MTPPLATLLLHIAYLEYLWVGLCLCLIFKTYEVPKAVTVTLIFWPPILFLCVMVSIGKMSIPKMDDE